MTTPLDIKKLLGARMTGPGGDELGTIEQVFFDDSTGVQEWARVRMGGLLGGKDRFVPLAGGTMSGKDMTVPFDKGKVKDSPELTVDRHISPEQEQRLRSYYGLDSGPAATTTTTTATPGAAKATTAGAAGVAGAAGRQGEPGQGEQGQDEHGLSGGAARFTAGTAQRHDAGTRQDAGQRQDTARTGDLGRTDPSHAGTGRGDLAASGRDLSGGRGTTERPAAADVRRPDDLSMVRSEERIHFRTEDVETGRVRLHKYVDVVPVEERVRLMHEEFELERVPATESGTGGEIREDEIEVVLRGQQAFAVKDVVPVERVRLRVKQVAEEKLLKDEVRRERIEVESSGIKGTDTGMHGGTGQNARKDAPRAKGMFEGR